MKKTIIILTLFAFAAVAHAESIINFTGTGDNQVALVFTAYVGTAPSSFADDQLDIIIKNEIPCTIFLSGKFVEQNKEAVKKLSEHNFIAVGNYTYNFPANIQNYSDARLAGEIRDTESLIASVAGKKATVFKFPARYNRRLTGLVESMGYAVIEGTDIGTSFNAANTAKNIKSGTILVMPLMKGSAPSVKQITDLVQSLESKGMTLVTLPEVITPPAPLPKGAIPQDNTTNEIETRFLR